MGWCALAHAGKFICTGAEKKLTQRPPRLIHLPAHTHQRRRREPRGSKAGDPWGFVGYRAAATVDAGPKAPVSYCSCFPAAQFFFPPHSPSDMGLPRSTLRWALVRVCTCRKIHLYGEPKKSTHGHQTHLPARTHQRQLVSGSLPPPPPPATDARQMAAKGLG